MTSHTDLDQLLGDPLFLTLSFLVKVSAGLFCAFDAKRHGKSPFLWFTVGFLLDLIGVVVWLVYRAWKPGKTKDGAAGRCPSCGTPQSASYGFCPRCGEEREPPEEPPAPSAAPRAPGAPAPEEAPPAERSDLGRLTDLEDPEMTATCVYCSRAFAPRKRGGGDRCPACELLRR